MQRLHEVFDQRRTVGGDEAQQSLHIEAVDDDRRSGRGVSVLPHLENATIVVDRRLWPESANDAYARRLAHCPCSAAQASGHSYVQMFGRTNNAFP